MGVSNDAMPHSSTLICHFLLCSHKSSIIPPTCAQAMAGRPLTSILSGCRGRPGVFRGRTRTHTSSLSSRFSLSLSLPAGWVHRHKKPNPELRMCFSGVHAWADNEMISVPKLTDLNWMRFQTTWGLDLRQVKYSPTESALLGKVVKILRCKW